MSEAKPAGRQAIQRKHLNYLDRHVALWTPRDDNATSETTSKTGILCLRSHWIPDQAGDDGAFSISATPSSRGSEYSLIGGLGMKKLILTAATTGAETTKEMNPNLPTTPEEQALDAAECVKAGASIIHLHVRDDKGNPSQSLDHFKASIEAIREACNPKPIIQISTGGAVGEDMEKRIAPIVKLKPEMASLNINSMNFGSDIFLNHPKDVEKLAGHMQDLGVIPEVEVYDAGDIELAQRMQKKGLLKAPVHYQFVLGVPGGLSGEAYNLTHMTRLINPEDSWAVAGVGRYETPLSVMAVVMGGFVRVGFEDNIYYHKGELAKSNAQLVERIARISKEVGREIATVDDTRKMLGIK